MNTEKMIEILENKGFKNVKIISVAKYEEKNEHTTPGRVKVEFTHDVFGRNFMNKTLIRTHFLPAGE